MTPSKSSSSLFSLALSLVLVLALSSVAACGGSSSNNGGEETQASGSCASLLPPGASAAEQCIERECCVELRACGSACEAFTQCLLGCAETDGGMACSDECGSQNPSGKDEYVTAITCAIDKCAGGDAGDQ
jgi:hypothetical protein